MNRVHGHCAIMLGDEHHYEIKNYLDRHFKLFDNKGKSIHLNWVGKEISDDLAAAWCYLEAPVNQEINDLLIRNDILMNLFDDQKNVIFVKRNNQSLKDMIFDNRSFEQTISLWP